MYNKTKIEIVDKVTGAVIFSRSTIGNTLKATIIAAGRAGKIKTNRDLVAMS